MMHNTKIYAAERTFDPTKYDPTRCDAAWDRAVAKRVLKVNMLSMAAANQPGEKAWFVLQVKPNCDKPVEKALSQAGVSVFMPVVSGGRKLIRHRFVDLAERPVIPGYIMVCIVPGPAAFSGLCAVKHAIGLVGGNESPHRVSDHDVRRFNMLVNRQDEPDLVEDRFFVKDSVRFQEGPFIGFSGEIVKIRRAVVMRGQRPIAIEAVVSISVKGQVHPITTPLAFLEKV